MFVSYSLSFYFLSFQGRVKSKLQQISIVVQKLSLSCNYIKNVFFYTRLILLILVLDLLTSLIVWFFNTAMQGETKTNLKHTKL